MVFAENVKNKPLCWDCGAEIQDGLELTYDTGKEKINVFKCKECFSKNPSLTNYQPCEVYSRVVGYYRPVQQWNAAKQHEFHERKEYKAI
jgi:anaerobic ribonucleoside-triphosphate reductase